MKPVKYGMNGKGVRKFIFRIVSVNEMKFGCMPAKVLIATVFILRMLQEECYGKGQNAFCKSRESFRNRQ